MKKAIKILAVLLAMMMLVTMATACKSADEEMDEFLTGETDISDNDDSGDDDGDVNIDDENDDPSDSKDDGKEDKTPGKDDNKNPDKNQGNGSTDINNSVGDKEDKEALDKLKQEYDGTKKYDIDSNPLFAEAKPVNTSPEPGFDLDTTGFVKNGVKLADLKGKTFIMITALDTPNWIYRGEKGETYTEWDWWDQMRDTYGLKVKYIKTVIRQAISQNLSYITSGKQIDVIPTHRAYFPNYLNLSQGLDPYINLNLMGNSPGVDNRTLELSKWGGTYRCISPVGAVDAVWYNATMVQQLGLKDPYETWKEGKWDWSGWKNFLVSVPTQGPTGQTLSPWNMAEHDAISFWPESYGITLFDSDKTSDTPKLINNFNDPLVAKSLEFYAATVKGVDFVARRTSSDAWEEMFCKGTVIMGGTLFLMRDFSYSDFANSNRFKWVPYPAGTGEGGVNYVRNYGTTMMLPRKMKVQKNAPYAVKFMELWANRFTEAINDNLKTSKYLSFDYKARKEYFEYCLKHVTFGIGSNTLESALTGDELEYAKQLAWSMYNNNWNTATAIEQLRNLAGKACEEMVKFGT